jgi:hypothetical protein
VGSTGLTSQKISNGESASAQRQRQQEHMLCSSLDVDVGKISK